MTSTKEIAEIMRCPQCRSEGLTAADGALSCASCQSSFPVNGSNILVQGSLPGISEDWEQKQADSVERYQHESYRADETIPKLFGGFIAVTLENDDRLLDIGCGLSREMPAYSRELRLGHYIGLEPLNVPVARDYDCLVGGVAENLPLADGTVDAAVLATSIDHIEDIDAAAAEIRRVLAPNGRIYLWVGVYDPENIARQRNFYNVLYSGSLLKRAGRVVLAPLEYAMVLYKMRKQRQNLQRGVPLDPYHCRYYTDETLKKAVKGWGWSLTRQVLVPGSGSMFVEARLS